MKAATMTITEVQDKLTRAIAASNSRAILSVGVDYDTQAVNDSPVTTRYVALIAQSAHWLPDEESCRDYLIRAVQTEAERVITNAGLDYIYCRVVSPDSSRPAFHYFITEQGGGIGYTSKGYRRDMLPTSFELAKKLEAFDRATEGA